MSFFESYFSEADFSKNEAAVCCPFPHKTPNGTEYLEANPSAHVNLSKHLFHCKVCGEGRSEAGFIAEMMGCSYEDAIKLGSLYEKANEFRYTWRRLLTPSDELIEKCKQLGISEEVVRELDIVEESPGAISFPVFIYDTLLDVRNYRPGSTPKIKSRAGTASGLIIPYDLWKDTPENKWTVICAGEKDMAVARSHGFNAITITGGEQATPLFTKCFKNRKIAICYDNDNAGLTGAKKLAAYLQPIAAEVRVITSFHSVCTEHGEDITDYFMKYGKTKEDLVSCIKESSPYTAEQASEEKNRVAPLIPLLQATRPQFVGRVCRSNIQVVATYDTTFITPTTIIAKKCSLSSSAKDVMQLGEERNWYFSEKKAGDVLHLIDNNFNEAQIRVNIRKITGVPEKEKYVNISQPTKETVHKCTVTDLFEYSTKESTVPMEFTAYSIKRKLESGKKYQATYKLVPHPYKGQALVMIILDVEDASDSVSNYRVTEDAKQRLDVIRNMEGTVSERIDLLTEKFKGVLGYDGYNQLIQCFDFAYHTVLEFNFGRFKNIRGYLDTIIVAESRVGKSTTAEAMQKLYGLGTFTSLAGSSATIAGLIGGSNKTSGGSYQTRAGLIPQNHRGLVIFEELAKSNANLIRELTDIKSSNQVRITRVNGTLNLPALVRMVTLTNVKGGDHARSIASYPNGIDILMELIGTPEDIARFDMSLILGERGKQMVDPFWEPQEPLADEVYRERIRWVWSRAADDVIISKEIGGYILECCNSLNKDYDCYIKIFGTEAWKKVSRLAIAVAGYLVSTNDSYEQIIVTKEHVDFAVQFLIDLYDNGTFRLKEYVEQERKYNTIDNDGLSLLSDLYLKCPALLMQLSQNSTSNRANLMGATGMKQDDFNTLMNGLVRGLFIRYRGNDIVPTERFRLGFNQINKQTYVTKVGEDYV